MRAVFTATVVYIKIGAGAETQLQPERMALGGSGSAALKTMVHHGCFEGCPGFTWDETKKLPLIDDSRAHYHHRRRKTNNFDNCFMYLNSLGTVGIEYKLSFCK